MGQVTFGRSSGGTPALPLTETGGPVSNMLNILLTKNSRIRELESQLANRIEMNGAAGPSLAEVNQASVIKDLEQQAATANAEKGRAFAERDYTKLTLDNHMKQVQAAMAQKDQELIMVKTQLKTFCDQVRKDKQEDMERLQRDHKASLYALSQQVEVMKSERDQAKSHCTMMTKTVEESRSRYKELYANNMLIQTQLESSEKHRVVMISMQEEAKAQVKVACDKLKAKHEVEVNTVAQLHRSMSDEQEKRIKDLEESLKRAIDEQTAAQKMLVEAKSRKHALITTLQERLKQQNEDSAAQVSAMKAEHERLMGEKERELCKQIKEAEIERDHAVANNCHALEQYTKLSNQTDTVKNNLLTRLEQCELTIKTVQEDKTKIKAAYDELRTNIEAALKKTSPLTKVDLSNTRGVAAATPKRLDGLASEAAATSATKRKSEIKDSSSKKRVRSEPSVIHDITDTPQSDI